MLTCEDQDQTFTPHDYILVNRTDPPPTPPPQDAPPEEVLKYQRDNMWVGRIQQAKAESPAKVWLRVFWFYWPEELPMGAQHYHGQSELVLSNYTDIIDATTISGRADISHWDEFKDSEDDKSLGALYWRQTFDVSKLGAKKKGGLSSIRRHCICSKEYNPDKTMFRCLQSKCGIWNHRECLEEELRLDLEARLQKRSLQGYLDRRSAAFEAEEKERVKSLGSTIAVGFVNAISTAKQVVEGVTAEVPKDLAFDIRKSPPKSPRGKPNNSSRESSRLQISIATAGAGAENSNGAVVSKIKLLPSPNAESTESKQWSIKLDCLQCGEPLD